MDVWVCVCVCVCVCDRSRPLCVSSPALESVGMLLVSVMLRVLHEASLCLLWVRLGSSWLPLCAKVSGSLSTQCRRRAGWLIGMHTTNATPPSYPPPPPPLPPSSLLLPVLAPRAHVLLSIFFFFFTQTCFITHTTSLLASTQHKQKRWRQHTTPWWT